MEDRRIISPQKCSFDESDSDRNLRPPSLSEFTGQDDIKESLSIAIGAAKRRGDALDHCLFAGPPGLGKTTLSSIIAKEMGVNIHITSGPVLEKACNLAGLLTSLQENDILFIDEIHRLNRVVEEYLYPAMEDFRLDIMLDSGPAARSVNLPLKHFTLVGATTRSGLLTGPLRDRFGLQYCLELYNEKDIVKILMRSARILGVKLTGDAANILGGRCRGTPRFVKPHLFIVAVHVHHVKFALRESFGLELFGKFANRLCMARANAMEPHKTRVIEVQHRAFFIHAVNRVRTVHHDHRDTHFFARFHAEEQRPDERVIARSYILQIHKHRVHMQKHFRRRLAMFTIKAVNRNMQFRVLVAFPFNHVVLRMPLDAVLRTKQSRKLKEFAVQILEQIKRITQIGTDRSRMEHRAQALAAPCF